MSTRSLDRRARTWSTGAKFLCDRSHGGLRGGRSEVDQSLVARSRTMRAGHMLLGLVDILTKRAAQGIAECEHALALDRNLADAHAVIGLGKIFIGRAEETEAHIAEALRLSPRDTLAYIWMTIRGPGEDPPRQLTSRRSRGFDGRSRPIEIIRIAYFRWPPPSRSLVDWTRRVPQSRPVSRSTRPSPSPASAPPGRR